MVGKKLTITQERYTSLGLASLCWAFPGVDMLACIIFVCSAAKV